MNYWESNIACNAEMRAFCPGKFKTLPAVKHHSRSQFKGHFEIPLPKDLEEYVEADTLPIPAPEDRNNYQSQDHFQYWVSGLKDYLKLKATIKRYSLETKRIFELGGSSGRVMRHFCAQQDPYEFWLTDLNQRFVSWTNSFLVPKVCAFQNTALPFLPIKDGYFDFLFAFSVFTHIDTFTEAWLAELKRILRPGGIAYLTIHSDKLWLELKKRQPHAYEAYLKQLGPAVVDNPLPEMRFSFRRSGEVSNTANVFYKHEYINEVWGRFFEILEIRPFDHFYAQDVVILRNNF